MALKLTETLKDNLRSGNPQPTLVMKIDGYGRLLSNIKLKRKVKIGDPGLLIGGPWVIGGLTDLENVDSLLQMDSGTTTKITQKVDPSRGQGSSVSQMSFSLIDLSETMTQLISPGFVLTEMLGRRVTVLTGCLDTAYPQDYNIVLNGTVQAIRSPANTIQLLLSNADEKKRVSVFSPKQVQSTSAMQFRSVLCQDILYKNREDILNSIQVNYTGGGTAGSEVVSLGSPYVINVQIQSGVSTASQIRKAIENSPLANQLVTCKIDGNSGTAQVTGSYTLGNDVSVSGDFATFLTPIDIMTTLATVEDELFSYTAAGASLTGITREVEGLGAYHATDKQIDQVLRFQDHGINIALKLMLSGGPTYYLQNLAVRSFEFYSISTIIDNAMFFDSYDLEQEYGITAGDFITITLATNGANNVVNSVIQEIGQAENGSYILLADNLVTEGSTVAVAAFKSKYNTLSIGMGMIPSEVDILQHEYVRDTFLPIYSMDIKLKSIDDGKDFLSEEIYKPMACYSVPRKGRCSLVHTTAPLPNYEVVALDLTTVENPSSLEIQRSTTENFVNQIQFDYDYDVTTDKFKSHKNYPEVVDQSRIPVGAKPFIIQSKGLKTSLDAVAITDQMADKYLRRYVNGAEFMKGVQIAFSYGYQLEIGDVVAVDYAALKLSDTVTGTRSGPIKLMEITNKIIDYKSLAVTIDVVNTIFSYGDRYGLISPSSEVDVGSTVGKICLKKSWSTKPYQLESNKYKDYIGQNIVVRSVDFTQVYNTVIRGFDTLSPQGMSIDPIAGTALEGWIVECVPYSNSTDPRQDQFWKQRHAFLSPQVAVVAGISNVKFTVAAGVDIAQFFVGSKVLVHNYDFSVQSVEAKVIAILGNDVTVDLPLGFVPDSTMFVDLIGFPDLQQAYRLV